MSSLNIAATGMLAQQLNVELISNNLANMNTTAFKRQRAEFQDLLYQDFLRAGTNSSDAGTIVPSGIQLGIGVRLGSVYRITEQGNLVSTNNTYDLAIQGKGYFRIRLPNGQTAYTRAGNFQLSPEGQIVSADGYVVEPGLTIPQNAIGVTINASGQVLAKIDGQIAMTTVGQLDLALFPNEGGLEAIGNNLFLETASSGAANTGRPGAIGFGTLLQGYVETANVNAVEEITSLITAQRAYEMLARVIETSDQMMAALTRMS